MDECQAFGITPEMQHEFEYVDDYVYSPTLDPSLFDEYIGCNCITSCTVEKGCTCLKFNSAYTSDGILNDITSSGILECSENCKCTQCCNTVVQKDKKPKMRVVHSGNDQKRYQVVADETILKGSYVCQYLGEVLSPEEARDRLFLPSYDGMNNYILCLAENFEQNMMITCIDAAQFGNVSRFMNHGCDPNLEIKLVRSSIVIPRACLFARRDISAGEELCYNYGTEYTEELTLGPPCQCGASNCIGFLPVSRIAATG